MVVKKAHKQTRFLTEPILFDHQLIQKITFDLFHINQGWDNEKHNYANRIRSSYNATDIIDLFEQFKYFQVEWVFGINKETVRIKGALYYRYFWETTDECGDMIRVVLDLPHQVTGEGTIVTVFKP